MRHTSLLVIAAAALASTALAPLAGAQNRNPPPSPSVPPTTPGPSPDSGSTTAPDTTPPRSPSQELNRSGGVLTPPESGSTMPVIPPPHSGSSMPVIPPPGTPGGDRQLEPK